MRLMRRRHDDDDGAGRSRPSVHVAKACLELNQRRFSMIWKPSLQAALIAATVLVGSPTGNAGVPLIVVAHTGQQAPDTPVSAIFGTLGFPVIDTRDRVAFSATL